jgi:hypothetical protein
MRLRQTTAAGAHANRGAIPRVDQSIAGLQNMHIPKLLASRAIELARQHARSVTTAHQPESVRWETRAKRVPEGIRDDADASHAHMKPVLLAIAAVGSVYWQQALGGPALCIRREDGSIACRVAHSTDGGMDMRESDAVIQLTENGPQAHGSQLSQRRQLDDPFCSAAAEAARLAGPPLRGLSPQIYRGTIACDEMELNASMVDYIRENGSALKGVAARMMQTKPPAQ